jgi:transposase IS166 family protein/ketopantoate reductase PanE/ApbA-like protein/helix-turn-helix protein
MRIAVMGAGAVGCYCGGMLARAGNAVTLIGRPQHVDAVKHRPASWTDARKGRTPAADAQLLSDIRQQIAELPSYGYRRACALVNRQRAPSDRPRVNPKRVYRVMAANGLLLPRTPRRRHSSRPHNGTVSVQASDLRWCVIDATQLNQLDAPQLREVVRSLMDSVAVKDCEIAFKQAMIDKITYEMAVLKRLKFAAKSEHFNVEQKSLLEETIDADLQALSHELEQLAPTQPGEQEKQRPKRQPLPAHLPRREIRHEPARQARATAASGSRTLAGSCRS